MKHRGIREKRKRVLLLPRAWMVFASCFRTGELLSRLFFTPEFSPSNNGRRVRHEEDPINADSKKLCQPPREEKPSR